MSDAFWSLVCLIGVWGFIACTIFLLLGAFPGRDLFDRRCAARWGGGAVLCFLLWIVGMTQA